MVLVRLSKLVHLKTLVIVAVIASFIYVLYYQARCKCMCVYS